MITLTHQSLEVRGKGPYLQQEASDLGIDIPGVDTSILEEGVVDAKFNSSNTALIPLLPCPVP